MKAEREAHVGNVVFYHSHPTGEPYAAIITQVYPSVSLTVFPPSGKRTVRFGEGLDVDVIAPAVPLEKVPFSEAKAPGHWSWPPHLL